MKHFLCSKLGLSLIVFLFSTISVQIKAQSADGTGSSQIGTASETQFVALTPDQIKFAEQLKLISSSVNLSDRYNLDRAVAAIQVIKQMPYSDIPNLLIDLFFEEFRTRRQKKRIIRALLEAITDRVTIDHVTPTQEVKVPPLIALDSKLLSVIKQPNFKEYRTPFLEELKAARTNADKQGSDHRERLFPTLASRLETIIGYIAKVRIQEQKISPNAIISESAEILLARKYVPFLESLSKLRPGFLKELQKKEVKVGSASAEELVYAGSVRIITDEIAQSIIDKSHFKIVGRDDILERVVLILSRWKQQNVVLVGSRGSGKTAIADLLAEHIVLDTVGENEVTEFLKGSILLQTSVGKISGLALSDKAAGQTQAMEGYFRAVSEVQKKISRRIVMFVDELHTLTSEQVEAIKPIIDSSNGGILLMGASTSPELRSAFKNNEPFLRRIQEVAVRTFSEDEILEIFKTSWLNMLAKRHHGYEIDENTMRLIIRKAPLVYPDKGPLDGALILSDDLGIAQRYKKNDKSTPVRLTKQDVYDFIKKEIGLPADPTNFAEMERYREKLVAEIKSVIIDQDRMVDDVTNLWMDVLRNESERGIRAAMIMGRSGTGKSELAKQLALRALGSEDRVFIIDGGEFKDANDIKLSVLFSVPGGVEFGKKNDGTLIKWLADPSKGKFAGIIVINEGDKANLLFWIRFMEFIDTGILQAGDGKTYRANRHLLLITSNRGDSVVFPKDLLSWSEDEIRRRVEEMSEEEIKDLLENKIDEKDENRLPDSIVNRIDVFTISNLITPRVAKIIARFIVNRVIKDFSKENDIEVIVDDRIIDRFVEAYNPLQRGARPLVRAIHRYVKTYTTRALGKTPYKEGDTVELTVVKNAAGEEVLQVKLNTFLLQKDLPKVRNPASTPATPVKFNISSTPQNKSLICNRYFTP